MPIDLFIIVSKGKNQIALDKATRKGTLVFSVTNNLTRDVKMRASATAQKQVEATLTVQPENAVLRSKETTSVSVDIAATDKAAVGSYPIELQAWDNEAPNEYSSKGPVATFEVLPQEERRSKWPWILVVVGGLIVVGLGSWLL